MDGGLSAFAAASPLTRKPHGEISPLPAIRIGGMLMRIAQGRKDG
jgi:hypothetical protein